MIFPLHFCSSLYVKSFCQRWREARAARLLLKYTTGMNKSSKFHLEIFAVNSNPTDQPAYVRPNAKIKSRRLTSSRAVVTWSQAAAAMTYTRWPGSSVAVYDVRGTGMQNCAGCRGEAPVIYRPPTKPPVSSKQLDFGRKQPPTDCGSLADGVYKWILCCSCPIRASVQRKQTADNRYSITSGCGSWLIGRLRLWQNRGRLWFVSSLWSLINVGKRQMWMSSSVARRK